MDVCITDTQDFMPGLFRQLSELRDLWISPGMLSTDHDADCQVGLVLREPARQFRLGIG